MATLHKLKPVKPQPGRSLYLAVRDAVREAIDAGIFQPGEQMPSTKELSDQLEVSLVTTHRALQELVTSGVLQRSQGKGTFVHERYHERARTLSDVRLGLIFPSDASLADFHHSQILEGVRQAAQQWAVDLVLLRFDEDVRNECNGYLFINPIPDEIDRFIGEARRKPMLIVGAASHSADVPALNVDQSELTQQVVDHLKSLKHQNVAYIGGDDSASVSRERWQSFSKQADEAELKCPDANVIKTSGQRLNEYGRQHLRRILSASTKPTAIFAAGYYFALDVLTVAAAEGLTVPGDLSIITVDDPPSAAYLNPPLTTLRQPLSKLGFNAIKAVVTHVHERDVALTSHTLSAELVVRNSTAPVKS